MTVIYRMKTASRDDICGHLRECDSDFTPPLSSRVDLLEYADKVFTKALSFEAWDEDILVGMINAYLNDTTTRTGFITSVSVLKEHRGKGVASMLLAICLEHAARLGFGKVRLEVSPENASAIRLYARAGFRIVKESGDNLLMECPISGQAAEELP